MADPTLVNGQITDAVTQSNITVLGDAPAQAIGSLYQTAASATGLAMQNAVAAQQQMNALAAESLRGVSRFSPGNPMSRRSIKPMEVSEPNAAGDPAAESAGISIAGACQSLADAVSLAMLNAVTAQQRASIVAQAVTARCVTSLVGGAPGAPDDSTMTELLDRLKSTAPGTGA